MGWASGSGLAEDLWAIVRKSIPPKKRKECARRFADVFSNEDCDTLYECEQLIVDGELCPACTYPLKANGKCKDADCQADQDANE